MAGSKRGNRKKHPSWFRQFVSAELKQRVGLAGQLLQHPKSLAHRQSLEWQQHEGSQGPAVKETRIAAKDAEFHAWTHL